MKSFIVKLLTGEGNKFISVSVSGHSYTTVRNQVQRLHPEKKILSIVEYSTHNTKQKLPSYTMGDMGQLFKTV